MKRICFICMLLFLCSVVLLSGKTFFHIKASVSAPSQIVIDAGHGGEDPGKIGINQALEKDVNLRISTYLFRLFKAAGYTVTMTRTQDVSLAPEHAADKKKEDLKRRREIFKEASPMAVISIHQNSYPSEPEHGAQVFYKKDSGESRLLASCIQEECVRILDPGNRRKICANDSYYLFHENPFPTVIVECGFLSNYREARLLTTGEYQKKTAWAVYLGTLRYLKTLE